MRKKLWKQLLPAAIISVMIAGCGSGQASTAQTTAESQTEESVSAENALESSDETKEAKDRKDGERGPRDGQNGENKTGGARVGDRGGANQKVVLTDEQQALIDATKGRFTQEQYTDSENGVTLDYSLYIPDNYDESQEYPLIMFIPDSSAAGKSSEEVLSQYYGADIWASDEEQEKHTSFVFCPAFSETVVDDSFATSEQIDTAVKVLNELIEKYNIDTKRIYTTGQSMGCMTSLYLNGLYPDLFAASLFVSGQWDITTLKPLENAKFFYITCTGDEKASGGQTEVMDMFDADGIAYSYKEGMDPDASAEEKDEEINEMLKEENQANFVRFEGLDHMTSFNYAYDLSAVRDWLFAQSK